MWIGSYAGRAWRELAIVPPKYSDQSVIIEVDQLSRAPVVGPRTAAYLAGRFVFIIQNLGGTGVGEPRVETSRPAPSKTTGYGSGVAAELLIVTM